jgi:hypothetical protein
MPRKERFVMKIATVASAIALVVLPGLAACSAAPSEDSEPQPDEGDSVSTEQPLAVVAGTTTINYSARFRLNANGSYGNPYDWRWRYPGGSWTAGDWSPTTPKSLVGIRGAHPTTFFGVPQMEIFNDSNPSGHSGTYYLHWSCIDGNGTRKGWQITRNFSLAPSFSYYSYTLTCPNNTGTVYYVEGTITID